MKKLTPRSITNPEQRKRRRLQLNREQVRLLDPDALAQVVAGCDTGSVTLSDAASKGC
jgi:hypothetical protein